MMDRGKNFADIYDVVIVGAGPAGMTAAIFARNKKLRMVIVDGGKAGGQMKNLYPYKPVYNYPGYSDIHAGELAERMIAQIQRLHIPLLENTPIETIRKEENGSFTVSGKNVGLHTHAIILASGLGLFEPRRLNLPGERECEEKGVAYSIQNIKDWRGKNVVVIGGGNSAVDNALLLRDQGCRVTLVHQLTTFQAEAASVAALKKSHTTILTGWRGLRFQATDGGAIRFEIEQVNSKQRSCLIVEKVLINIGLKPQTKFLNSVPLELKGKQIRVDSEMRTSISGIFGCGDAVYYPGKVRLIVTAIGEAATAVNSLQQYLKQAKFTQSELVANEKS